VVVLLGKWFLVCCVVWGLVVWFGGLFGDFVVRCGIVLPVVWFADWVCGLLAWCVVWGLVG